jgi:hypothetical protein
MSQERSLHRVAHKAVLKELHTTELLKTAVQGRARGQRGPQVGHRGLGRCRSGAHTAKDSQDPGPNSHRPRWDLKPRTYVQRWDGMTLSSRDWMTELQALASKASGKARTWPFTEVNPLTARIRGQSVAQVKG